MAIELAKAYVQIVPSARGIRSSLSETLGSETEGLGEQTGQALGSKLAGAFKAAVGAAALGKVVSDSIEAGGALQQSLGGIETLFKGSADTVKNYAAQAYRSAGLSANAYMEAVTGFSATLLQGLGGDTEAAARIANQALVQMSDNANKMGTGMASVQYAYQAFARQNYTLLDNLKLGYGGTQAEMARLINESGVLGDAIQVTADTVNSVPFDRIIEAIGVIQDRLGITGATAQEAATTLTGSFAAMSAAFQNLLGSIALGEGLTAALAALVETTRVYLADNLLPMAANTVSGILTSLLELAPEFLAVGAEYVRSISGGLTQAVPELLAQALPALMSFSEELRANFGLLVEAGIELVLNLLNGIIEGLPQLFAYIPDIVINLAGLVNDNAPRLLAAGAQLIVSLASGLLQSIPLLVQNAGKIVEAILAVLAAVNWIDLGASLLRGIAEGVKSMAGGLLEAFKGGFSSALSWLQSLPSQALQWGKSLIQNFINGISGKDSVVQIASAATKAATTAATAVRAASSGSSGSGGWGLDDNIVDKAEVNAFILQNAAKTTGSTVARAASTAASTGTSAARTTTSAAKTVQKAAATVVSSLKTSQTALTDGVKTVTETTKEILSDGTEQVKKTITETQEQVIDGALKTVETVRTIAADGTETVARTIQDSACASFAGLWSVLQEEADKGVLGSLSSLWDAVQSQDWAGIGQWAAAALYEGLAADQKLQLQNYAAGLIRQLNEALGGVMSQASAAAWDLGGKLASGLTSGFGEVTAQVVTLGDTLRTTLTSLKGPLSAAAQAISSAMSGGLLASLPSIYAGFAGMVSTIGAAVGSMLTAVSAALSATVFGIPLGAIVAAAAVALGVAIAAICASLGGSSKPSSGASTSTSTPSASGSTASVSDAVFDTGALLWDYEKNTAEPARTRRPAVEVNQYIYSKAQTAADLMREAQYEQERAVLQGV